jgi:CheY-like chemotaxis protein
MILHANLPQNHQIRMPHLAPAPVVDPHKPAILLVDDAPDNLGLLRTIMVRQGYQTFVANCGDRALDIALRVKPDLILLDIVMPGMDGLETCRRLKAHPATTRIPVIFMSARDATAAQPTTFRNRCGWKKSAHACAPSCACVAAAKRRRPRPTACA